MPQGGAGRSEASSLNVVQRQLDPNESARWGLILAALLLVAYAVGAGPVNFMLAARAGKPLRALLLLPAMAGATFLAIVGLAVASKGWRGEARRLSLIEASGGMSRGPIRRYRGFFSAAAQKASVRATGERGAPVLLAEGGEEATLHVERSGLELRGVEVLPWQTVVVREDDMARLGGGVSLTRAGSNDVAITNRLGRDLRGLVVRVPDRDLFYLPALRDGASALASSGEPLHARTISRTSSGPSLHVANAHLSSFTGKLNQASRGLGDAWEALHTVSDGWHIDWWPEGQPVVLAQVDGGEGASSDQGLRLTRERLLLRVVGYGGAP